MLPVSAKPRFDFQNTNPISLGSQKHIIKPCKEIKNPWLRTVVAIPLSIIDIATDIITLPLSICLTLINSIEIIARLAFNTLGLLLNNADKKTFENKIREGSSILAINLIFVALTALIFRWSIPALIIISASGRAYYDAIKYSDDATEIYDPAKLSSYGPQSGPLVCIAPNARRGYYWTNCVDYRARSY